MHSKYFYPFALLGCRVNYEEVIGLVIIKENIRILGIHSVRIVGY